MAKLLRLLLVLLFCVCVENSDIFHVESKITFRPNQPSDYFGYSVLLTKYGLVVGAPKAINREFGALATGVVFNCTWDYFDRNQNVTCKPLSHSRGSSTYYLYRILKPLFRDDMWFGASLADIPDGKLLISAPRWYEPYMDSHLLAKGALYVHTPVREYLKSPLTDNSRLAYVTDGKRPEYGTSSSHINFYAYGQAAMSLKVTDGNDIIAGAPGLVQWTGGYVNYKYSRNSAEITKLPVINTYFTPDLGPDDYFGYSVEAGTFLGKGNTFFVGGAPRSKNGFGQILIFETAIRSEAPLRIRGKVTGPQLGAYFGASLCCTDIDGDGRSDLLVGAPNFVKKDGSLPYDQGAVFVYMTRDSRDLFNINQTFLLEESEYVSGSEESGARFGTAIASLGDIDVDGFNDVAIGAPYENQGSGVVYIYRGSRTGLLTKFTQRILAENSDGFGISISRGLDVDNNHFNDLAVGSFKSSTAYLYRCIPTLKVRASIDVPDAMDLPHNATNFTALFCVKASSGKVQTYVQLHLKAKITIDPEDKRAAVSGDSEYKITITPESDNCDEQIVNVHPMADLSKPIPMTLEMELDQPENAPFKDVVRLSEDSVTKTTFLIQLMRDCGEDFICTPWLVMSLEPFNDTHTPGMDTKIGFKVKVLNKEEPAYGVVVNLNIPSLPKRLPTFCALKELNVTCNIPAPLNRNAEIEWLVELEDNFKGTNAVNLNIKATVEDSLYYRNITDDVTKEVVIHVKSEASFNVSGQTQPNSTIAVARDKFNNGENISFVHYFELTNYGPSDWYNLEINVHLPEKVYLSNTIKGCQVEEYNMKCNWTVPAKVSLPIVLNLRLDLGKFRMFLEGNIVYNASSVLTLRLDDQTKSSVITTTLVLDPVPPIWHIIVGVIGGLLILSALVFSLYKMNFFSRRERDELNRLIENEETKLEQRGSCSSSEGCLIDDDKSSEQLILENSDSD